MTRPRLGYAEPPDSPPEACGSMDDDQDTRAEDAALKDAAEDRAYQCRKEEEEEEG